MEFPRFGIWYSARDGVAPGLRRQWGGGGGRASMSDEQGGAKVEIFGVVYPLKGSPDPGHLRRLGELVDERMRRAADLAPNADRSRLAILAALNLADELIRSRGERERDRVECAERVAQLTEKLADAV